MHSSLCRVLVGTSSAGGGCAWGASLCDAPGWKEGQSHRVGAPLGPAEGCYAHGTLSLPAILDLAQTAGLQVFIQLRSCICVLPSAVSFFARGAKHIT